MSKTCIPCATTGRLTCRPCANHEIPADPATCKHELTSYRFTHNGLDDAYICHACGATLDNLDNTFDRDITLQLMETIPTR